MDSLHNPDLHIQSKQWVIWVFVNLHKIKKKVYLLRNVVALDEMKEETSKEVKESESVVAQSCSTLRTHGL